METLTALVPITVVAAVALFFLKEILEFIRRYRSDNRKKSAIRKLLARECELNHWTIKRIRDIVETIRDESSKEPETTFSFLSPKSGAVLFRYKRPDQEYGGGSSLATTHNEVIDKQILEVAALDKTLYPFVERAYGAVADLEHIRQNLIYFVSPEDEQDEEHLGGFTDYALRELDDIYKDIAALYKECTGKPLEAHRLR